MKRLCASCRTLRLCLAAGGSSLFQSRPPSLRSVILLRLAWAQRFPALVL